MWSDNLHDNTLVLLLEPLNSVLLCNSVVISDLSRLDLASGNSVARSDKDNVEIHTENTYNDAWQDMSISVSDQYY